MMWVIVLLVYLAGVDAHHYKNISNIDPVGLQLLEFKKSYSVPVGIQTVSAGAPVDVRDNNGVNSDFIDTENAIDSMIGTTEERIPHRVVHAKGAGALGYFEVTHDVSHYTKADVFNGIGKKTPVAVRFSIGIQDFGGNDLEAVDLRGMGVKFYTREGNLDLLGVQSPVYIYNQPIDFTMFLHVFKRNPRTNLQDFNARWDLITSRPASTHCTLWLFSDYGLPDGYRKSDYFPVHTFRPYNHKGEVFFARFNWRTEQGLANLTIEQTMAINDNDYYSRDLYNAIGSKNYPSWRLEMDVLTTKVEHLKTSPFDVTNHPQKGTFITVPIGRMTLTQNPDNFFRDVELMALNPANLVPGIGAPIDKLFKAKRLAYRDTHNHRLGKTHANIPINEPLYAKTYNRDGPPPVGKNMGGAPNYWPNMFYGPTPYVDEDRPMPNLQVLERNSVDLQPSADFYNEYVKDEGARQRIVQKLVLAFNGVIPKIQERVLRLMRLVDKDLGTRLHAATLLARAAGLIPSESEPDHDIVHDLPQPLDL